MSPNGGGEPTGELAEAIKAAFGSYDAFKDQFKAAGEPPPCAQNDGPAGVLEFSYGWAWVWVGEGRDGNGSCSFPAWRWLSRACMGWDSSLAAPTPCWAA